MDHLVCKWNSKIRVWKKENAENLQNIVMSRGFKLHEMSLREILLNKDSLLVYGQTWSQEAVGLWQRTNLIRNQKASRMETHADESGAKSGSRRRLKLRERTRCEIEESLGKTAQRNSMRNRGAVGKLVNSIDEPHVKPESC